MKRNVFFSRPIFLLICTWLLSCSGGAPKPGEAAPDFSLKDTQGKVHSLSDYRGKLVMVNFWTDNCDICKKEFPLIESYYKGLDKNAFEILSVYIGADPKAPAQFKEDYGLSFPLLADGADVAFGDYDINATPTNFLVNPDGKVVRKIVGFVDGQQIEAILYNLKMNPDQPIQPIGPAL